MDKLTCTVLMWVGAFTLAYAIVTMVLIPIFKLITGVDPW